MMGRTRGCLASLALGAALLGTGSTVWAQISAVRINEIRLNQPGTNTSDYIELTGPPNQALDGLWFVSIGDTLNAEGAPAEYSGGVEIVLDMTGQQIAPDGFFLIAKNSHKPAGIEVLLAARFPQGTHDQRRNHGHNLANRTGIHPTRLTDRLFDTGLPPAQHMPQNTRAVTQVASAPEETGHIVQHTPVVVAVQSAE